MWAVVREVAFPSSQAGEEAPVAVVSEKSAEFEIAGTMVGVCSEVAMTVVGDERLCANQEDVEIVEVDVVGIRRGGEYCVKEGAGGGGVVA